MGLATSGNLDPTRRATRRCSNRCTGPPRTSRDRVRPTRRRGDEPGQLLDHLGEDDAAPAVDRAVARWLATRGNEAGGLGYSTEQVGDRLAELVA
jgi:3-isopropylmalate dehydrogenase